MRDTEVSADGLVSLCKQIATTLSAIDEACSFGWANYAATNIPRNIVIAWLRQRLCATAARPAGPMSRSFGWDRVTYAALEKVVAGNTKEVTEMPAAVVSSLVLGRTGHALCVSMWAFMFGEVERMHPGDDQKTSVLKLLKSPEAAVALAAFKRAHGVAPCPVVLVKKLHQTRTAVPATI